VLYCSDCTVHLKFFGVLVLAELHQRGHVQVDRASLRDVLFSLEKIAKFKILKTIRNNKIKLHKDFQL